MSRDEKLLNHLQSYGCLTTRQIQSQIFPGVAVTTVLRRLRCLREAGFIEQVLGLESSERLWILTRKAVDQFEFQSAKLNFPRAILEHDSLLTTLRLRLEETGLAHSWIPEHAIRKRVAMNHGIEGVKRRVIPDGIMGVTVNGVNESVAIELELSNKNQERYREILWDYSRKESLFAVWYIVKTKTNRSQIEQARTYVSTKPGSPKILFSFLSDVLENPLATSIIDGKATNHVRDYFSTSPAHLSAQPVSGST